MKAITLEIKRILKDKINVDLKAIRYGSFITKKACIRRRIP